MTATMPEIAKVYLATVVSVEADDAWSPAHEVAGRLGTLHVLTAWNPGDERPSREENELANESLRADLVQRGLKPMRALGADPKATHIEESWAVTGLTDAAARELGAKYRQVAVFRITPVRQTVLGCLGGWEVGRGV